MKNLAGSRTEHGAARNVLALAVPFGCWLALAACASMPPPTAQMAVSTAAVADAVKAGGPELAPAEMRSAREKLDHANLAMASQDYQRAGSLAEEAQVDAQLAAADSRSIVARKAAAALQDDTRVLREEIDRKTQQTP